MNRILKIWMSILTNIGTFTPETKGIFSDTSDGFRAHRQIYDSLITHIMMYEDAKLSKHNIYTTYLDFKSAFGGMDHRIVFQNIKNYGFQDSYIATCQQIYSASNTYYMTIHGNTLPILIHRGTLEGDILPPSYSQSSWNHCSASSQWEVEDTAPPTSPTALLSYHYIR
jgi:hypothetical protein